MSRLWCYSIPFVLAAGLTAMPVLAQESAPASSESSSEPVELNASAIHALSEMGKALRALKSFEVKAEITDEKVSEAGQKLAFGGQVTYKVQVPGHLYATVDTARKQRRFYFDGENLTVYAPRMNYYASAPAKGNIAQLIEAAQDRYGIELPLADLFYWGTDKAPLSVITSAIVLGPELVNGVETDHLALRQPGVDWQVWIARNNLLPQKIIITSLDDPTQPEYTSVMSWNTTPALAAGDFQFKPDSDDHRIKLNQTGDEASSKEKTP